MRVGRFRRGAAATPAVRPQEVVIIEEPNPAWPVRFDDLAGVIERAVGLDALRIDHIGSTSVAGLAAKDVIDIQVTVERLEVADHWPDVIGPFRRQPIRSDHPPAGHAVGADWEKRFWSASEPRSNLHVRERGRSNQRYALLFRDFLRSNDSAAIAYEQGKRRLASLAPDVDTYADAKDPICDLVMEAAERWASQSGWSGGR